MTPTRSIAAHRITPGRVMALVGVFYCAAVIVLSGCRVTNDNYTTLSFFFDGVPDPNAPPVAENTGELGSITSGGGGKTVAFIHKPYAENKCDACHTGNAKKFEEFQKPDPKICVNCHEKELNKYPVMHGPVAVAECLLCHSPHESTIPGMLNKPSPDVCAQCHLPELLPFDPPEHQDAAKSCLDCHVGHGADKHGLLRKTLAVSKPTTAPAPEATR